MAARNSKTIHRTKVVHDTTGSSLDSSFHYQRKVEHSLKTTTEHDRRHVEPQPPCPAFLKSRQHPKRDPPQTYYGGVEKRADQQQQQPVRRRRLFVTDSNRAQAPPPDHLDAWTFYAGNNKNQAGAEKYDPKLATIAFSEYTKRLKEKKRDAPPPRAPAAAVAAQKCGRGQAQVQLGAAVELTNKRNDEVKIDSCHLKKMGNTGAPQQYEPAFYGTIEAQQCATRAAQHLTLAGENLKKLQFIAGEVFPASIKQLEAVNRIGGEIKDFNAQLRSHRARVPKAPMMSSGPVAHFVIDESSTEK